MATIYHAMLTNRSRMSAFKTLSLIVLMLLLTVRQYAAIARTCYKQGSLPGLNSSVGCRTWTNSDNFTATYCFCDTDMCNVSYRIKTTMVTAITSVVVVVYYTAWAFLASFDS